MVQSKSNQLIRKLNFKYSLVRLSVGTTVPVQCGTLEVRARPVPATFIGTVIHLELHQFAHLTWWFFKWATIDISKTKSLAKNVQYYGTLPIFQEI